MNKSPTKSIYSGCRDFIRNNQGTIKSLVEYLPLLLFVIVSRYYGLPSAILTLVGCSLVQVLIYKMNGWKFSAFQRWGIIIVVGTGLISLGFKNPLVFQLKPTLLFTLFSLGGLIFYRWKKINWVERMYREAFALNDDIKLPVPSDPVWQRWLLQATFFFLALATLNIVVVHYATEEQWVNFKVFGLSILTLIFFAYQALSMVKASDAKSEPEEAKP